MPRWSIWAESATDSAGLLPARSPHTFCDSSFVFSTFVRARKVAFRGKRGKGLPAVAISSNRPSDSGAPSKSHATLAALRTALKDWPRLPESSGSSMDIEGRSRAALERSQGTSAVFGFVIDKIPSAPAAARVLVRSPAEEKCARRGPGRCEGDPEMITTSLPRTSWPAKSS